MSVQFFGWEVTYDDSYSRGKLGASQEPKDCGIYTMYHGTTAASARQIIANGFQQSSGGMLGKGVYVSRDKRKAQCYPKKNQSSQVVLKLRVRVGRVKRIDTDNHPMQKTWNAHGYDTAWVPAKCGMTAVPSGREEDCVFDPKRVKVVGIASAANAAIQTELQQLLANSVSQGDGGAGLYSGAGVQVCSLCKQNENQGSPHIKQQCWGCGQNICAIMNKHFCPVDA